MCGAVFTSDCLLVLIMCREGEERPTTRPFLSMCSMHYLFCVKLEMRELLHVRRPLPDVLRVVGDEEKDSGAHMLGILASLTEIHEISESEQFNTQNKLKENR